MVDIVRPTGIDRLVCDVVDMGAKSVGRHGLQVYSFHYSEMIIDAEAFFK